MDGDAVRKSEAALRKEVARLKAQLAAVPPQAGTQMVAVSGGGDSDVSTVDPEPKTQADTMKELATDESLSEEARESAKKALEVLVSSQLLDIEQEAALKKRAGALKDLESEAQFINQQAQICLLYTSPSPRDRG